MSPRLRRNLFRTFVAAILAIGAACTGAYLTVKSAGDGRCFDDVANVPARPLAMVLGCPKILPGGKNSLEYRRRIAAAAELFKAGKCERILVSSDLDAPEMMRDVIDAGVPASKISCDPLGVRTRDSFVRAKEVFGITSGIVVSQRYHNERSLYIADEIGADWIGYDARDAVGPNNWRSHGREVLARVKAWLDRHVIKPEPKSLTPA